MHSICARAVAVFDISSFCAGKHSNANTGEHLYMVLNISTKQITISLLFLSFVFCMMSYKQS